MGGKLLWTGLTFLEAGNLLPLPAIETVGAVLMIIGLVLLWLDK